MRHLFDWAAAALLGTSVWSATLAAPLTHGGIEVWGEVTDGGYLELTFRVEPTVAPQAKIHSVQFFSMPSGTPLAVVVNPNVPPQVLARGKGLAPRALARVTLAGAPVSLYLAPPPPDDTTIRVEYTVEAPGGEIADLLMAEGVVGNFSGFHFTVEVEPVVMMPIDRECIFCGDLLCGCTSCGTWQVCCPSCAVNCNGPAC